MVAGFPLPPLSAALAARRNAAGLRQAELADLLGVPPTTVGHAESGRLWQDRDFWESADRELGGGLLLMYLSHRARNPEAEWVLPVSVTITPDGVAIVWPEGTEFLARPPRAGRKTPGPAPAPSPVRRQESNAPR